MTGEGSEWDRAQYLSFGEDWWPPFQVRLELVEGCALRCHSCGISGIREPKSQEYHLMDRKLAKKIGAELQTRVWKTVIVLTGRGEPAYHPKIDDIIFDIRSKTTINAIMMETSGHGLIDDRLTKHETIGWRFVNRTNSMMELGLTAMSFSRREQTAKLWDSVDDMAEDAVKLLGARLERCYVRHIPGPWDRVLCLLPDVRRVPLADREFRATAHCGAGDKTWPKNGDYWRKGLFCGKPARELVVRWDGRVTLCSEDWRGEVLLGDLNTQTLEQVWYGEPMRAARARAMAGLRDLRPCSKCDYIGDRRMLHNIPKSMFVKPTDHHREEIEAAILQEPMTIPVRRPWEPKRRP